MGIIVCILLGLFMALEPITDNDYFWHIVVGKWINNNHAIPNTELFSWVSGKAWVNRVYIICSISHRSVCGFSCIA